MGKVRPSEVTMGASPLSSASTCANNCVCAVADIAKIFTSVENVLIASRRNASPRSVGTLRSCTSSKITRAVPSSVGSFCKRRVRIPSVRTSMRVVAPIFRSSRVWYPTVSPTFSPSMNAMRCAAARAARRRGSSITILRPATQFSCMRRSGTSVVLPAPGGAMSTACRRVARASRRGAMAPSTGRPVFGNESDKCGCAAKRARVAGPRNGGSRPTGKSCNSCGNFFPIS